MSERFLEGGCLCGATRYRVRGEPVLVSLCHCSMCRRAAGAPAVGWVTCAIPSFELTAGAPKIYPSSKGVERGFCDRCGTPLTFSADFLPGLIDVTLGSFDEAARLEPQMHIWESSRLPWLNLADDLPRHAEFPPLS